MRKRKGSLLLIITFGGLMAWVVVSMMTVAVNLYAMSKNSAGIYADIQTYRSAVEIACHQYIYELCNVRATKDLSADWIGMKDEAIKSRAINAIKESLGNSENKEVWAENDMLEIVSGLDFEGRASEYLLSRFESVTQELTLRVPDMIQVDGNDSESWIDVTSSHQSLTPFRLDAELKVRGEKITQSFIVANLYVDYLIEDVLVGADMHKIATISISEGEGGVKLTYVPVEEI